MTYMCTNTELHSRVNEETAERITDNYVQDVNAEINNNRLESKINAAHARLDARNWLWIPGTGSGCQRIRFGLADCVYCIYFTYILHVICHVLLLFYAYMYFEIEKVKCS